MNGSLWDDEGRIALLRYVLLAIELEVDFPI